MKAKKKQSCEADKVLKKILLLRRPLLPQVPNLLTEGCYFPGVCACAVCRKNKAA